MAIIVHVSSGPLNNVDRCNLLVINFN